MEYVNNVMGNYHVAVWADIILRLKCTNMSPCWYLPRFNGLLGLLEGFIETDSSMLGNFEAHVNSSSAVNTVPCFNSSRKFSSSVLGRPELFNLISPMNRDEMIIKN